MTAGKRHGFTFMLEKPAPARTILPRDEVAKITRRTFLYLHLLE